MGLWEATGACEGGTEAGDVFRSTPNAEHSAGEQGP